MKTVTPAFISFRLVSRQTPLPLILTSLFPSLSGDVQSTLLLYFPKCTHPFKLLYVINYYFVHTATIILIKLNIITYSSSKGKLLQRHSICLKRLWIILLMNFLVHSKYSIKIYGINRK